MDSTTSTKARLAASQRSRNVPKAAAHLSNLPQLLKMWQTMVTQPVAMVTVGLRKKSTAWYLFNATSGSTEFRTRFFRW